ncbi:glycosyl transferase [Echinicola pacifica]|uniref:Glycosyl transferase n=1 Tax=Echinicola pacifica TaxID=346377 RepID=A0A918PQS0_9BACT|nr:glycosyltransferase [Echinicola pacifica]GGZ19742.1 glycosyl transferase [Echinicola pacifica]
MIRVLVIHSAADLYGASRNLVRSVQAIIEEGMEPIVVLPFDGPLVGEITNTGATVHLLDHGVLRRKNLSPAGLLSLAKQLWHSTKTLTRLIKSENVQLVYTNSNANVVGGLLHFTTKKKHVWHIHEIIQNPRWFKFLLEKYISLTGDSVLGVSQAVLDNMQGNVPSSKLKLIYNGIDYRPFKEADYDLKREIGIPDSHILIGMIARVHFWKGQSYFLDIAKHLAERHDNIHFVMVGDAFTGYEYLYDEIKERIREHGLEGKVSDLGYRTDIPNIMGGLDIFMLPSILPDPLPTTVLEAMAAGKPVIATAHGGATEMVLDGETGFLVPWDRAEIAASKFDNLIKNAGLRHQMGLAGQARVIEHFSVDAYFKNLGQLFRDQISIERQ